jgi:hypothetical protein
MSGDKVILKVTTHMPRASQARAPFAAATAVANVAWRR